MKAVIIVDMVKGFVDETVQDESSDLGRSPCLMYLPGARELIPGINMLIDTLDPDDIIIHMNDTHQPDDKEFDMFLVHCLKGTEECKVADGFEYGGRQHINLPKTRFSAFHYTELLTLLRELEIEDMYIVGVCTEICIMHTAAAARMYNLNVSVPNISVSGLTEEGHEWALEHMKNVLGVTVL